MTRKFKKPDYEATLKAPIVLEEALPANHLARFVVDIISQLDLSRIYAGYAEQGGEAIAPEALLGLLFFGYATGIFSSRKLEKATYENLGARYVAGGLHPDHGVLSDADGAGQRTYTQSDPWHAAQSRVVAACRAYGLRPLDGAFGDIKDTAGFSAATKRAAAMGFAGRMVIHPSQIAPSNQAFSPSDKEVADARRVLAAMEEAARERRGAVQIDGKLIDMANLRMAQNIVWMADAIAAARQR